MSKLYNDSELQMYSALILCIEEHDDENDDKSIDNRLFIGRNYMDNNYFVRGKRHDINARKYVPYALQYISANSLYDFIKFVMGTKENVSISLYNYNNINVRYNNYNDSIEYCLPCYDELTYEFFEEHMDKNYEISAYDNVKLKRSEVTKLLKFL